MASPQKRKGGRFELQFAKEIGGTKTPLSGALGGELRGDVIGPDGTIWECKARADGFKQLYAWLENKDGLALKADRKPILVVMTLERYKEVTNDR